MLQVCPFCRIVAGEATAQIVYQDDDVTAFHDINPQAPTHILIVPNRHITDLNQTVPEDTQLLGRMLLVAQNLAAEKGLQDSGYRLVLNTGPQAGQSVYHVHLHLLGGRRMHWPPG